jgi:hypothetical protein
MAAAVRVAVAVAKQSALTLSGERTRTVSGYGAGLREKPGFFHAGRLTRQACASRLKFRQRADFPLARPHLDAIQMR